MSEPFVNPLSVVCPVCEAVVDEQCINIMRTSERKKFVHPARAQAALDAITVVLTRDFVHQGDARLIGVDLFALDSGRVIKANGYRVTITGTLTMLGRP